MSDVKKKKKKKSKQLDHYLRNVIQKVPEQIEDFLQSEEPSMTYYTGSWASDVLNNFTEKQSEKIFNRMKKFQSKCFFTQKKLPYATEYIDDKGNSVQIYGYEYQVRK